MRTRHEDRGERQWPGRGREDDQYEPREGWRSREDDRDEFGRERDFPGDGGRRDRRDAPDRGEWRTSMGGERGDWRSRTPDRGDWTGSMTDHGDWRMRGMSEDPRGISRRPGGRSNGGDYEMDRPYAGSWSRGPHTGKGPSTYQRSDDRIREDVCDRLTMDGDVDATGIEVSVSEGEVTLTGTVDSRQAKRAAEDAIESVPGIQEVHNQLRVSSSFDQLGRGFGQPTGQPPLQSGSSSRPEPRRDQRPPSGQKSNGPRKH